MRTVLFHRNYKRFQGGHLKVFHYFEHVRSSSAFQARIRFSEDSVWDHENPWSQAGDAVLSAQETLRADVEFLAGMDWRTLSPEQRSDSPVPIINLIQALRHVSPGDPAHEFLAHPAIRICVSPEIQEAVEAEPAARGPVFTVPIGFDLQALPAPRSQAERDVDCVVLAVKDRHGGRAVARRLRKRGHRVLLVEEPMPRAQLLDALARATVSVHLPKKVEGAYLPALESMALGALVVCPDCVGNRSFCRDGDTCLMPDHDERAIAEAALQALDAAPPEREPMLAAAARQSAARGLGPERESFLRILARAEQLWAEL